MDNFDVLFDRMTFQHRRGGEYANRQKVLYKLTSSTSMGIIPMKDDYKISHLKTKNGMVLCKVFFSGKMMMVDVRSDNRLLLQSLVNKMDC